MAIFMKVAFITRSTWQTVPGGDTVQLEQTVRHLRNLGVKADIFTADQKIDYAAYDLFHFFNITRPADLLLHTRECRKPYVITPILVNYSEYDRHHRKGISGFMFRFCSPGFNEYAKTIARWLLGKDKLISKAYLWKGQTGSMREVVAGANAILPNSTGEQNELQKRFDSKALITVVPNGIDTALFVNDNSVQRDEQLVICVARIEGIKNQLNLIRGLNGTEFSLILIGGAAAGQRQYYKACREAAADNIQFKGHIAQTELLSYYQRAKVHVLPSWFETCGLSSLEAGAMGCRIVVTDKGYTRDYFGEQAFYADPSSPASILETIRRAATANIDDQLAQKIRQAYTWQQAAAITFDVYKKIVTS